jgi:hypothetical protein
MRSKKQKKTQRPKPRAIRPPAPFTREERVAARNELMRRYIKGTEGSITEARAVLQFVAQDTATSAPEYGEACEAQLERVMNEARGT